MTRSLCFQIKKYCLLLLMICPLASMAAQAEADIIYVKSGSGG